ncbi:MAG TPA: hypothetical protein VLM16_04570 [Ginsengibacter sp.]|nr:hypothetical protein [Ginsengibacter sp.]
MKEFYNKSVAVIVLFVLINAAAFLFTSFLHDHGFGIKLLLTANLLLFLLTMAGFFIQMRAIKSANINAFIRGVYVNLLVKIFVVIIGLAIYLFITKGKINKPSLFTAMGLYILYSSLEVRQLMKISRKKTDA